MRVQSSSHKEKPIPLLGKRSVESLEIKLALSHSVLDCVNAYNLMIDGIFRYCMIYKDHKLCLHFLCYPEISLSVSISMSVTIQHFSLLTSC